MEIKEMIQDVRYIITKSDKSGTFDVGEHITLEADGSYTCSDAGGWLEKNEMKSIAKELRVRPDFEWIARRKKKLQVKLDDLIAIEKKLISYRDEL